MQFLYSGSSEHPDAGVEAICVDQVVREGFLEEVRLETNLERCVGLRDKEAFQVQGTEGAYQRVERVN